MEKRSKTDAAQEIFWCYGESSDVIFAVVAVKAAYGLVAMSVGILSSALAIVVLACYCCVGLLDGRPCSGSESGLNGGVQIMYCNHFIFFVTFNGPRIRAEWGCANYVL
jgi:hypothetical protein